MKVIWENGKPDPNRRNWLCPECRRRPPASAVRIKDGEPHCIFCGTFLDFDEKISY